MLSRKVVTRSGRGFRGYFPSKKLNRSVQFESLLERDAISLFERSDAVLSYQEQPTIIHYYDGLEQKKYFPDFELIMVDGSVIHVEVKPAMHLLTLKLSNKYRAIKQHYLQRPEFFVILTDKELRYENSFNKNIYDLINTNHLGEGQGGRHEAFHI